MIGKATVYPVRDAAGNLVAEHVREDTADGGKRVRWRRPDGSWGLNGTKPADLPLYGAHLVSDAGADDLIVLTEGEKARDALAAAGLPAVGTVTGAGGTPGTEALEVLRDRRVCLWSDNDAAGREHMRRVAEALRSVAAETLVYTWDEAPDKGDAADHPAVEGRAPKAVDRLLTDLEGSPRWKPEREHSEARDDDADVAWEAPAPLPDDLSPVATFDADMLPGPLRAWVLDISERMQVPPDYCAAGAVVAAASLIGRKVGIRPKRYDDWLVVPNLWGAVVGPPATLKSPALAEVTKPLDRLVAEARAAHEEALEDHAAEAEAVEAIKAGLKDQIKAAGKNAAKRGGDREDLDGLISLQRNTEIPKPPTMRRYRTNDTTVEKLAELLGENPRGLLVSRDELSGLLRSLEKQGREADRAFYLEAWNGTGSFEIDRIGRGSSFVQALCVSVLGGIQPGPLSSYVYEATTRGGSGDDGLLQRFQLLVWPDPPKGPWRNVDRHPDRDAKNRAHGVYKALDALNPEELGADADTAGDIPCVRFSPEAQEVFDAWRGELEATLQDEDLLPALQNHLAKYRSLMPSLALIFHLVDYVNGSVKEGANVGMGAAERAAAWCEYLKTHAERVYASAGNPAVEGARALLTRVRKGDVKDRDTIRDIYRKQWSRLSSSEEVMAAASTLEEYGWVRVEKVGTGGRPTARLRLHTCLRKNSEEA